LIGLPLRITIGPKSLARKMVELKRRADTQATEIALDRIVDTLVTVSRGVMPG
jgi:prolyl-tRNA synthetase